MPRPFAHSTRHALEMVRKSQDFIAYGFTATPGLVHFLGQGLQTNA